MWLKNISYPGTLWWIVQWIVEWVREAILRPTPVGEFVVNDWPVHFGSENMQFNEVQRLSMKEDCLKSFIHVCNIISIGNKTDVDQVKVILFKFFYFECWLDIFRGAPSTAEPMAQQDQKQAFDKRCYRFWSYPHNDRSVMVEGSPLHNDLGTRSQSRSVSSRCLYLHFEWCSMHDLLRAAFLAILIVAISTLLVHVKMTPRRLFLTVFFLFITNWSKRKCWNEGN